jgi:hypothetical protein
MLRPLESSAYGGTDATTPPHRDRTRLGARGRCAGFPVDFYLTWRPFTAAAAAGSTGANESSRGILEWVYDPSASLARQVGVVHPLIHRTLAPSA